MDLTERDFTSLLDTMFATNESGRLLDPAPHFHLLRTRQALFCKVHACLPDALARELDDLSHRERSRPAQWQREYGTYLDAIAADGWRIAAMRAGPLYVVPQVLADVPAVPITKDNAELLHGGLDEWMPDVASGQPIYAAIEDDRAVAVCASVSASPAAHCAGVETVASHRGRGLAAAAVAGWATAVRALGAKPFYATTFDNLASQRVAQRMGMLVVGSEFSVRCVHQVST